MQEGRKAEQIHQTLVVNQPLMRKRKTLNSDESIQHNVMFNVLTEVQGNTVAYVSFRVRIKTRGSVLTPSSQSMHLFSFMFFAPVMCQTSEHSA